MILTRVLLVLGVVAVVPLALRLQPQPQRRVVRWAAVPGVVAGLGLGLPAGPAAAATALPWAALAGVALVVGGPTSLRQLRASSRRWDAASAVAPLAALAFWTVGAVWLVLDRLALDPAGVGADLVLLTAVHFHFAGLVATTIVAATVDDGPWGRTALVGTLCAPVLVAVGFIAVGVLQVVGAVVFTIALLAWSLQAGSSDGGPSGGLWLLARLSVWVSMPLAAWWATGFVTGLPAPSIPVMAATHGVVNALGFALAGVLALRPGRRRAAVCGTGATGPSG